MDGTVGTGGHTLAILQHFPETTRVLGFDRDAESLAFARERLKPFAERVTLVQGAFGELARLCSQAGFRHVDGILLDLGFSSYQLAASRPGIQFPAVGSFGYAPGSNPGPHRPGLVESTG